MHQLTSAPAAPPPRDDREPADDGEHVDVREHVDADAGFTLIELVVTVAIVGFVVVALTGVVLGYLKTTVSTQARMTESHDIQFASAYWQRDVGSIGVRSTTYDSDPAVHSFPLLQSVAANPATGVPVGCALPSGPDVATVVTLGWTEYDVAHPDTPRKVTVTYLAKGSGTHYALLRVRCTGSTKDSTATLADNLVAMPSVTCSGKVTGCNQPGANVPMVVTLTLTADDPDNKDAATYTATLTGQRRQT